MPARKGAYMFSPEDITPFTVDDMEYHGDPSSAHPDHGGFNEYYKYALDNGDILELTHYGWQGPYRKWEWKVYVAEDFPIQGYQTNYRDHTFPTAEEALDDFFLFYEGRRWLSRAEYKAQHGPTYYRCLECGWEGGSDEIDSVTVYEDYGDVSCLKCPGCGRIEYDGMEMLVVIDDAG